MKENILNYIDFIQTVKSIQVCQHKKGEKLIFERFYADSYFSRPLKHPDFENTRY